MTRFFFFLAIAACLLSCGKDKFQTKPQIEIKSINGQILPLNAVMNVYMSFTDKEGDIGQGKLVYSFLRLNRRPLPTGITYLDSIQVDIPKFPNKSLGEMQLNLKYSDLHKSSIENDTIKLRFVATDKAGHRSDTLTTDRLVILYR